MEKWRGREGIRRERVEEKVVFIERELIMGVGKNGRTVS